jgi:hypothetical protein
MFPTHPTPPPLARQLMLIRSTPLPPLYLLAPYPPLSALVNTTASSTPAAAGSLPCRLTIHAKKLLALPSHGSHPKEAPTLQRPAKATLALLAWLDTGPVVIVVPRASKLPW